MFLRSFGGKSTMKCIIWFLAGSMNGNNEFNKSYDLYLIVFILWEFMHKSTIFWYFLPYWLNNIFYTWVLMFVSNQNVQRKDHHNSVLTIRAVITQQIYIFFLKKHKTRFQCAIICRNCFQFVRADVLQINIIFLFLVLKFHFFAMIFSSKTFDVDETILIFLLMN